MISIMAYIVLNLKSLVHIINILFQKIDLRMAIDTFTTGSKRRI